MYRPSTLREFLTAQGLHPKKGLSQNFLIDGNTIRKIATLAGVAPGDSVIEIGPGPGALTEELLRVGARVLAIEIDSKLASALERLQTEDKRLTVLCCDALDAPYEQLAKPGTKVVANLPYHITTPLIAKLLPLYPRIESLTIMVQQEVGDRMRASVGTSDYSSLTLLIAFYADVTRHFTVSPNCFYPRPKVHSSVVHCRLHPPALAGEPTEGYFRLTRTAFQHRRKMLRAALKELYPPAAVEQALITLGLSPTARPEELSLTQFIALYRYLK